MSSDCNGIMIPGAGNVSFQNCGFMNSPNGFVIVDIDTSAVDFQDCKFIGNKTAMPIVIQNKDQSVNFNRCLFQDNSSNAAGAIQIIAGNVLVQNSNFKNNTIAVWVGDQEVKTLRHISVTWTTGRLAMKNCMVQGLNSSPSSITTETGSPFAVDASNKDWN